MAEHYANNAQHELERLAGSHPLSARIVHVLRLHAVYSAIAATAQLPEDSDFDEPDSTEKVETERLDFVHPDRLALMTSGRQDTAPPVAQARGRSPADVSPNANSVVPRNARKRRRSRYSSVKYIIREHGLKSRALSHRDHVDTNKDSQQWAPASLNDSFQPSTEFHETMPRTTTTRLASTIITITSHDMNLLPPLWIRALATVYPVK